MIRFARSLSDAERAVISNGLQNYFLNDFTVMMDVTEIRQTMETAIFFITLFNVIVAAMASILTFFFTLVSFIANVQENSWEFGVLRAIGVKQVKTPFNVSHLFLAPNDEDLQV